MCSAFFIETIERYMSEQARKSEMTTALSNLPGSTKLVHDYISQVEPATAYYAGGAPNQEGLIASVNKAASRKMDRQRISDVLVKQNSGWGMPAAVIDNARLLAQADSAAIVTGQQVGLLGGPLYTIYKTITAIRIARELSAGTGKPVIPVFWVEGEDHDFDEIASFNILRSNEIRTFTLESPSTDNPGAVGRLLLSDGIEAMLEELASMLPPSDFHEELFGALREAYAPGRSIEDAFVAWWKRLFADYGLVFMNPDDRDLKQLTTPLFEREIQNPSVSAERVEEVSRSLESEGYHAQVNVRPSNIFLLTDAGRLSLDVDGDGFVLRGTDRRYSREEMVAWLKSEPEAFSPNVVLRPLMQDMLLPTAAYIAGPGEIAYFAQYRGVYDWAGINMPVIYPRASATLIEPKVEKVFERYDISLEDFVDGIDTLFSKIVRTLSSHDFDAEFSALLSAVNQSINDIKPTIEDVDRNLGRTTEATRAAIIKEIDRLKDRVLRAEKRRHDEVRSQLEKTWVNILPEGRLQERVISPVYFLNKYGFSLIDQLMDGLDVETHDHKMISL